MTSLERIQASVRRQLSDRVPVAPYLGNHGARVAGVPIDQYCRSGKLMAEAQYRAWEIYQQDAVVPQSDNYSLASLDMISPAMYRKWAWPYERKFFTAVNPHAERRGAATLLHICGNMTAVLELMADTGAHILELDSKVDLKTAKEKVGRRVCLMGNLNPVTLLWQGTPAAVTRAAEQAIQDAGAGGGFILGSGCEVPVATPRENLHAMVRAARQPRASEPSARRRVEN